jgi:hypothetical protein
MVQEAAWGSAGEWDAEAEEVVAGVVEEVEVDEDQSRNTLKH